MKRTILVLLLAVPIAACGLLEVRENPDTGAAELVTADGEVVPAAGIAGGIAGILSGGNPAVATTAAAIVGALLTGFLKKKKPA